MSKKTEIGIKVGAALALAATSYFLYGTKEGNKQRARFRGWVLKAKGEVLEALEKLSHVDEATYNKLVDRVAGKYKKIQNVPTSEVIALADELKEQWVNIEKYMPTKRKTTAKRKPAKKAVKRKPAKKTAKRKPAKKKTAVKKTTKRKTTAKRKPAKRKTTAKRKK